ncbi:hypothetical protein PSPO01_02059 [Paraphaeosphaeria sporulosa]
MLSQVPGLKKLKTLQYEGSEFPIFLNILLHLQVAHPAQNCAFKNESHNEVLLNSKATDVLFDCGTSILEPWFTQTTTTI